MLSCSIRFSAPSFWMGGGLESRCVVDGAVRLARHHPQRSGSQDHPPPIQNLDAENHTLQLNI